MASFLIQALPWAGVPPPPEQQMVSGVLGEAAEGDWEGLTAPDPWSPSFPSSKSQDGASLSLLLLLLSHFSRVRLCDPIDDSPPGSHVPGILQARTLEWVAISFSSA